MRDELPDAETRRERPNRRVPASPRHASALTPPSFVRIFCAVELPAEVRARAAEHIARLREAAGDARASWERAEKMHITLKFLGEIEAARVSEVSSAAERAVSGVAPFELIIEGAGAFPPRGQPRVLWLGVADASARLSLLHQQLEDECARRGFAPDERRFHPHLTLARLRGPQGARRLASLHEEKGFASTGFTIRELLVMRSELGPGGSRYTVISRHELELNPSR